MNSCQSKKFNVESAIRDARGKLSLARCRELLENDSSESDADLELLRDHLYALACVTVEAFTHQRCKSGLPHALNDARHAYDNKTVEIPTMSFSDALALLPTDERYALEERAGIYEDSGLERGAAEQAALLLYWQNKNERN